MIYDEAGNPVDYRFLNTDGLYEEMTGLPDPVGKTANELVPGIEPSWMLAYSRVAKGETLRLQEYSPALDRWFDVFATPAKDIPDGFMLLFRDVTAHKKAELEREEARARAENLLVELNHRVMNTLAIITAIVLLESQGLDDPAASHALRRLETRLASVTSLYRALHRAADVTQVATDRYLPDVAQGVAESLSPGTGIAVICDCQPESVPADRAIPLGLLLNELMTNALKYAFPDGRGGTIRVTLRRLDTQRVALIVADDGVGTKAALARPPAEQSGGTGSRLIEAFVQQIDGTLDIDSSAQGTRVTITFPLAETASEG